MAQEKEPLDQTDELKIVDDDAKNTKDKKTPIKILFLDIDGVMNGSSDLYDDDPKSSQLFKPHRVQRLKHILDKTNCKIVLSTAWRRSHEAKQQIKEQFVANNIKWEETYIGDTPILDYYLVDVSIDSELCQRTFEIATYLKSIQSKYLVQSWCAVDDMSLDLGKKSEEIMNGRFVQTDGYDGITDQDTIKIINILNYTQ